MARRIPYIQQLTAMDCGIACLAMVLGYHGKHVRLDDLRAHVGRGRQGSTALDLLRAARKLGLDGHGVRVEDDEVGYLEPGAILHWRGVHFIVFERFHDDEVDVVDPAIGRATMSLEEFNKNFSHIALLLEPTEALVPSEVERGSPTWNWMVSQLKKSRWGRILVTSGFLQLLGLAIPLVTGAVVDRVLPRGDYHLLFVLLAGFACVLFGQFVATVVRVHLLVEIKARYDLALPFAYVRRLTELPLPFFQQRQAGDLISRYGTMGEVRSFLTGSALSSLLDGTLALFYFTVLFAMSPILALATLVVGALLATVFLLTRKPLRDLSRRELEAASRNQERLTEMVTAMSDLKAMGAEVATMDEWVPVRLDYVNITAEKAQFEGRVDAIKKTLQVAAPLILLGLGAQQVLSGTVSLGAMLGLWALSAALLAPLGSLIDTATNFQSIITACERIDDIFRADVEQPPGRGRKEIVIDGSLALDNVSFRYAPDTPAVLHEVSFTVEPGKMIALVGRSGSGKSTLSMLLLGLYKPQQGVVSFNGVDVQELELRALRQQMGIVLQSPHIFSGTIRENILKTAPTTTDEEINQAISMACLEEDLAALPGGLDAMLPDGGTTLSGGQKQRLAIARALARKPKVLVMDEATSALDAITEHRVHQRLKDLRCTRVVIAHRLSTIVHADVILVMHEGRVAERGTHDQLLARGGIYAELVHMQLGGKSSAETEVDTVF